MHNYSYFLFNYFFKTMILSIIYNFKYILNGKSCGNGISGVFLDEVFELCFFRGEGFISVFECLYSSC